MKVCKKIFHLLSIFVFFVPSLGGAFEFQQVDFERLLNNHPLMKNYDPESGRFKNTPSEIIPVPLLEQRVASISGEIRRCEKEKSDLVAAAMNSAAELDENKLWGQIGKIDLEISALQKRLRAEETLLEQEGVPGFETLFSVVTDLTRDVIAGSSAENRVVINKLPRFRSDFPRLSGFDLRRFFYRSDPQFLEKYLEHAGLIGLLFAKTDNSVIYKRNGAEPREK